MWWRRRKNTRGWIRVCAENSKAEVQYDSSKVKLCWLSWLKKKTRCVCCTLTHCVTHQKESEISNIHILVCPSRKSEEICDQIGAPPSPAVYWEKTKAGRIIIHKSQVYTINATLLHQQSHGHEALDQNYRKRITNHRADSRRSQTLRRIRLCEQTMRSMHDMFMNTRLGPSDAQLEEAAAPSNHPAGCKLTH